MWFTVERVVTPYERIEFGTLVDLSISNSRIVEDKIYGPVYPRLVKRFAVRFESEKLGEEPPEGAEEWDWPQVKGYLEKNLDRYPYGFNALLYAMAKTEATLQGTSGVANRVSINEMAKHMDRKLGVEGSGRVSSFEEVFRQPVEKLAALRVLPPGLNYSIEEENTARFVVEDCAYRDVCEAFHKEKITKYNGEDICSIGRMITTYIELELSPDYDYHLEDFASPQCSVRITKSV